MRWTPHLEQLADVYVREAIGVPDHEPIPAFITIHARRTDFKAACRGPLHDCFAPLSVMARRVKEVQDELAERGVNASYILMTSDEKDPEWWQGVWKMGWSSLNHTKIVEKHGKWYPILIDAVIQSNCAGFVGTEGSTMSIVAVRRVETWHNGVTRLVKWGQLGADDH